MKFQQSNIVQRVGKRTLARRAGLTLSFDSLTSQELFIEMVNIFSILTNRIKLRKQPTT